MIGERLSHYRILEEIGAGGMGVVYRARDDVLRRDVAVKMLPAEVRAHPDRMRRFEDEARAAGALNHPNILAIYDFGEHAGSPYFVCELLEGSTLRETLRKGSLSTRQALSYGAQIASGLSAAHRKGVVHRDVKPENLFVTVDGHVKILDFGLAKVLGLDAEGGRTTDVTDLTRTQPGAILGTTGYMSPEQVRGLPADQRSDIFGLGAVLYEMLTGERTFSGATAADRLSAILNQEPPAVSARRADVPPSLDRLVRRCLEKDPERRYQSARDLSSDLEGLLEGRADAESPLRGRRLSASLLLIPIALLAAVGLGLLTGKLRLPGTDSLGAIRSIAVLPLANYTGAPEEEYFVDGITEELTTRLAQIGSLRVIARTSAMRYKGARESISQIGRELKVDAVVEGSVHRSGDRVRVTAQLIRAATEGHIWAQSYDRNVGDILALQSDVAQAIVRELRARLTPSERNRLTQMQAVDPAAHEAYLRGRYLWNQRTAQTLRRSIQYFEEAIAKDSTYALAYAGLASACNVLPAYAHDIPMSELVPKSRAALNRALELDPNLGEAHAAYAGLLSEYDWNWAEGEAEFRRAIDLAPSSATAHQWYGEFLIRMGRLEEAKQQFAKAADVDPLSPIAKAMMTDPYYMGRQYDRAIEVAQKTIETFPDFKRIHSFLANIYLAQGMYELAILEDEKVHGPGSKDAEMTAFKRGGARAYWRKRLELHIERGRKQYVSPSWYAIYYANLGERDSAFAWLDRAAQVRDMQVTYFVNTPYLDSLRLDPRFAAFRGRVGLPN